MAATTDRIEGIRCVKLSESFMLTEKATSRRPEARITNQAEVVFVMANMGREMELRTRELCQFVPYVSSGRRAVLTTRGQASPCAA